MLAAVTPYSSDCPAKKYRPTTTSFDHQFAVCCMNLIEKSTYKSLSTFVGTSVLSVMLVILSVSNLLYSPTATAQDAVTFGVGTLDSSSETARRRVELDFDSLAAGQHTLTVSWDSDADVRFRVFRADDGIAIDSTVRGSNPGVWTGELDADTSYYIGLWSVNGIASYTATIETSTSPAGGASGIISEGTLDSSNEIARRRVEVDFDSLAAGEHTLTVSWDSNADIRFRVFQADGTALGSTVRGSNPGVWTDELDADTSYYVALWSAEGVASYTATLEADSGSGEPALEIVNQPTDVIVTEGDNATFNVTAIGSGELTYQWFSSEAPIAGAISDTLNLTAVALENSGTVYTVQVTDENSSVVSASAVLTVNEDLVPVTTVTIGQGTLHSDRIGGPRRLRHNFDSLAGAEHTVKVSWDDNAADIRFRVFNDDDTAISPVIQGANPGVWAGGLDANTPYYISVWAADGIATYSATVEASIQISITRQPSDLIVTEGENADFVVEAAGSGPFSYQWFADGTPLTGETGDRLTVFSTFTAEDGTEYNAQVSNGAETVTSEAATLTVEARPVLGLFSQEADTAAWVLEGPAPTVDFNATATTDGWGQALLRVDDLLLVGGDFTGISPTRNGSIVNRPFLAAFNAVSGQPVSTFQVPPQVDSVVRNLVLSPDGRTVYVAGDFGLLALDAVTGQLDFEVTVTDGSNPGRVFDIAVSNTQLYIGGDFSNVDGSFRANIARLSLEGELDSSWSPNVTNGFGTGRAAPVQSIAVSPSADKVYIGGTFEAIDNTDVSLSTGGGRISMLVVSALDGTVQPERFSALVDDNQKGLTGHDIAVTDSYVIVAWGGPNFLTFHSLDGTQLQQYRGRGDIQALQVVGDYVFVGHHGEFFNFVSNANPPEAVVSRNPDVFKPFKLHSFRIDDPSFPAAQAWALEGAFGVWDIAAHEDSIWATGDISQAGSNDRPVEGLVKFPALD